MFPHKRNVGLSGKNDRLARIDKYSVFGMGLDGAQQRRALKVAAKLDHVCKKEWWMLMQFPARRVQASLLSTCM